MILGISGKIGSGKDTVGKIIQYLICLELNTLAPHQFSFKDFVKSTASNEIQSGFKIKKFADNLKDTVCLWTGCTRAQLEDQDFKNKELGEEWNCYIFNNGKKEELTLNYNIAKTLSADNRIISRILTPRLLLQLLGTECGRNIIHPNIWVNTLFADYKSCSLPDETTFINDEEFIRKNSSQWIITDMRFPNELEAVKSRGGITIRVNRPYTTVVGGNGIPATFSQNQFHPSETSLDNAEFDYTIENNSSIEDLIHTVSLILKKEKII